MGTDLNIGLGVSWQPGLQAGLIQSRGAEMIHELGVACSRCHTADVAVSTLNDGEMQARLPHCHRCGGLKILWRDPVLVTGLVGSIRGQRNVLDVGEALPGDCQISLPPNTLAGCTGGGRRVAKGDRFTATWPQPIDDGQTIVRGAATLGDNPRLKNRVADDEDRLWYEPAEALWCEDEHGNTYTEGDFILGPGRVIRWINGPPIRTNYTLKFTAYFEWLVWAPPQERVDRHNQDLGPLVLLRRRHVAMINESPYIADSDRVTVSSRVGC